MGIISDKLALGSLAIGDFLGWAAALYPNNLAFIDPVRDVRLTYKEFNNRVNGLAHGLIDLGLKKGEFCAILAYNRQEYAESFWALSKIGVVIAPLPYRLIPDEMKALINLCEASTIIFEERLTNIIDAIKADIKSVQRYICIGEKIPQYAASYESLMSNDVSEPQVEIAEEDPHVLNFSSGTTGLPKGILQNNFHNTYPVGIGGAKVFGIDHSEWRIYLNAFPLYSKMGWIALVIAASQGATCVSIDFDVRRWVETVEKEKVQSSMMIPTMAQFILLLPDLGNYDLSSLNRVTFVSAPLSEFLYQEICKKICPNVWEYYGFQEGNASTVITAEAKHKKPASVGPAVAGASVRIVDVQTGKDVPQGEVGEIVVKGFQVVKEYYKSPEATEQAFKEGWFYTADLGRFDEDGYLYIVGRVKDMIISGGYNVFASEVEDIIMTHPKVTDCAVIGLPDKLWGEVVTAVVVPKEGEKIEEEDIIEFCKERITHYKAPKVVKFIGSIPKSPVGKVLKFQLVEKYSKEKE